jgi:rubredoxin
MRCHATGVYVQNLSPLVPPASIGCQVPSDCILQVINSTVAGVPPQNLPPGTILLTLPGNCSCPLALIEPSGVPVRADSYSPQDQFSSIPTPVISWSPKYGCQVLQHVTVPVQKVCL